MYFVQDEIQYLICCRMYIVSVSIPNEKFYVWEYMELHALIFHGLS